jgi:hypothetical protein
MTTASSSIPGLVRRVMSLCEQSVTRHRAFEAQTGGAP